MFPSYGANNRQRLSPSAVELREALLLRRIAGDISQYAVFQTGENLYQLILSAPLAPHTTTMLLRINIEKNQVVASGE
jgi:hypothetical protein